MSIGPLRQLWNERRVRVAAAFPSNPRGGDLCVRSDLDFELFYRDSGRSKWLSVRTLQLIYTNQNTVTAGGFLRLSQGVPSSSSAAFVLPWAGTLVETSSLRVTSGSSTQLDLRDGVTAMHSHTIGSGATGATETNINVDLPSGATLNCYANTALTGGGHILYTIRRTAT